tara:strand:- start:63 stop:431 length:369 start_codon:yes stop_codon:yes gene_type:complete
MNSNRSFGILFFIVFLLISVWPIFKGSEIRVWALIISLIFLFLGLINSKILSPLNKSWIKFGELLGRIIAPIVMGLIFFLVVTPIGLLLKLFGKDVLNLKFTKADSYWLKREKNIKTMKKQF